ncbi:opacity family porin [Photobacterium damselae]|uniref:opacity family porin n=1 Tax=Photobacterium damselae TaxID=38293 RepID=UPI0040691030
MKKTLWVMALAALPSLAYASVKLPVGTQELGVQGHAKLGRDYRINLEASYGKFIRDSWELGATTSINLDEQNKLAKLGIFTEYNFTNTSSWVPFVGAATELAALNYSRAHGLDGDLGQDGDSWALNIKLTGGVKYFVNQNVALSAAVNYNIATDDISLSGDQLKNSLTNIVFGTRFYF